MISLSFCQAKWKVGHAGSRAVVAKRLGKEMLAEGGSPWDRRDDNRNRNVFYFQGTVIEEACVTGGLWPNFFACIPGKLYQIACQRDKNRHKRTLKNSTEAIASDFAHILPNVRAGMTLRQLKAFCKRKQNQFRCLFWSRADRGMHNMPKLVETRDRVGRHQLLINQQGQSWEKESVLRLVEKAAKVRDPSLC